MIHRPEFSGSPERPTAAALFSRAAIAAISLVFLVGCGTSGGSAQVPTHPLRITSLDGSSDTITFHIGSPLFLRIPGEPGRGCEGMNGHFFVFGENESQLGWGFREIADSIAFPEPDCVRYLLLPSEESNGLAEGYYRVSVALLLDEKSRRTSDTVVLHPIHAPSASPDSYAQFLLEQLVLASTMLRNEATVSGLFADHLPKNRTIDLYEGLIRYRIGDLTGAREALARASREGVGVFGPHAAALHARLSLLVE